MGTLEDRLRAGRCLGKLEAKHDPKLPTFRWLTDGAVAPLAPPPQTINWTANVAVWPMLGNDKLQNCTIAGALHQVQLWTAATGRQEIPDLSCAIAGYAAATGYNPVTGAGDAGAYAVDILRYWMTTGLPVSKTGALNRLDGYATIDPADQESILRAIATFGTVYAGVELPQQADYEFENGRMWADLVGAPGSLGGHLIPLVGASPTGPLCVTWGRLQQMTWAWWFKYASEAFAVLRRQWVAADGLTPSGLTMYQLDGKITDIRGWLGLGSYAAP